MSSFAVTFACIFYCFLFIPTNTQTYILKYFISTPTYFSVSDPTIGVLILCLPKLQIINFLKIYNSIKHWIVVR